MKFYNFFVEIASTCKRLDRKTKWGAQSLATIRAENFSDAWKQFHDWNATSLCGVQAGTWLKCEPAPYDNTSQYTRARANNNITLTLRTQND